MTTDRQIAAIGTDRPAQKWRAESDGDYHAKTFYVINSHTLERIDCASMADARNLAQQFNAPSLCPS
jgi:hypothetical protein